MNFLSQFDNVVRDMLGMAGGTGILRVFADGVYVDGEVTRTSVDYPIEIALNDFPQANSGEKSKFGTLIESDDKELMMRPINKTDSDAVQPSMQANRDLIITNGIEWKILALKEINPSGVNTILYTAHLRR
jgi:hypothetical protein